VNMHPLILASRNSSSRLQYQQDFLHKKKAEASIHIRTAANRL
jgi:hypothetical protein